MPRAQMEASAARDDAKRLTVAAAQNTTALARAKDRCYRAGLRIVSGRDRGLLRVALRILKIFTLLRRSQDEALFDARTARSDHRKSACPCARASSPSARSAWLRRRGRPADASATRRSRTSLSAQLGSSDGGRSKSSASSSSIVRNLLISRDTRGTGRSQERHGQCA